MVLKQKSLTLRFKAQFTIIALVMLLITLIAYVYIMPVFISIINSQIGNFPSDIAVVISLVPFLILIAILVSIVWYIVPHREESKR